MQNDPTRYVYFVQAVDGGPIKIGSATDVKARLSGLQTSTASKLVMLGYAEGSYEQEHTLHGLLKEHRLSGEWFSPHPDVLLAMKSFLVTANPDSGERKTGFRRKRLYLDLDDSWSLWSNGKMPVEPNEVVAVYNRDLCYAWGPAAIYDWEGRTDAFNHIAAYTKLDFLEEVSPDRKKGWNTSVMRT